MQKKIIGIENDLVVVLVICDPALAKTLQSRTYLKLLQFGSDRETPLLESFCSGLYFFYSESQINEYRARAHKMSSSKFILKCMRAVRLSHWSAQKESYLDVRSFKGLNTIYENISKYHCS